MKTKLVYGISLIAVVLGVGYLNQDQLRETVLAHANKTVPKLHPATNTGQGEMLSPALLLPNESFVKGSHDTGLIKVAYQPTGAGISRADIQEKQNTAGSNIAPTDGTTAKARQTGSTLPSKPGSLLDLSTLGSLDTLADIDAVPVDDIRVLLVPDSETTIASTAQGRLTELKTKLGQRFEKGDLLAAFDCSERKAQVDMAKAEFLSAVEQHEAKIKMQGLDQASDVEVAMAASESNKAKANLALNRTLAGECNIYAPWAGRVAQAYVKKHMIVAPGEPLLDIVNTGRLKLKINVPSKQLANIRVGKKFYVKIDETEKRYQASISAMNSKVDPVSQTVEVEATLTRHYSKLLAGMSGTADLFMQKAKKAAKVAAK